MYKKIVYIPGVVKWNINQIDYILTHPECMGSGSKEQWEEKRRVLEELLRTPYIVEVESYKQKGESVQ